MNLYYISITITLVLSVALLWRYCGVIVALFMLFIIRIHH